MTQLNDFYSKLRLLKAKFKDRSSGSVEELIYSCNINGEKNCPILSASPPVTAFAIGTIPNNQNKVQIYWSDKRQIFLQELDLDHRCQDTGRAVVDRYYNPEHG